MKKRKSQSQIVSAVIIVLIVITSAVIVWNVANYLTEKGIRESDPSIIENKFEIIETRILSDGEIEIKVKRGIEEAEINHLKFIFYNKNREDKIISVNTNLPKKLETKSFIFNKTELPLTISELNKISLIPVFGKNAGIEVFEPESEIKRDSDGNRIGYIYNDPGKYSAFLVSWWRFEKTYGTGNDIALDSVNGNPGYLKDGSKILNKVLDLDGINDYVSLQEPPSASTNINEGSISAWIKTNQPGASYRGIVVKQNSYNIFIKDSIIGFYDYKLSSWKSTGINLTDGEWHFIGMTFKNGTDDGAKIYIDGRPVFKNTLNILNQNESIVIGAGDNPATKQYFKGEIDDVAIFNKLLNDFEINEIYYNQKIIER